MPSSQWRSWFSRPTWKCRYPCWIPGASQPRRPVLAGERLVVLGASGERREYRSGVRARRRPTDEDRVAAMRGLLGGLANGDDVFQISTGLAELHPRDDTFPGEVFIDLAADALALAGVNRQFPIDHEGLVDRFLPECEFRGRANHKIRSPCCSLRSCMAG